MIEPITIETARKMLAWMNDEIDDEDCPYEYSLRGHLLLTIAQQAEIERLKAERDDLAGALKSIVDGLTAAAHDKARSEALQKVMP